MEGSPVDRLFYFGLILAAFITISRRGIDWSFVISKNWPVFLFYAYLLITVLWAESSIVSFKRWVKDFGNIFVVLVILTEVNPQQAFRAVFVRCAYLLIPLSIVLIRYFPSLGRTYSRSGGMEATGVTSSEEFSWSNGPRMHPGTDLGLAGAVKAAQASPKPGGEICPSHDDPHGGISPRQI